MDLGLERAGMVCKWQVEIDDYARRVLAKHWPSVPKWDDVRTFPPTKVGWGVDLIAGGFPCQPHSTAGKRGGTEDERWLWPEFARIIRSLHPTFVLVENVPGLLSVQDGEVFGLVLGELASLGYDAEWSCLSACSMGAAHTRDRVFIVAYSRRCMGEAGFRIREHVETRTVQAIDDLTTPVLRMESAHRDGLSFNGLSARVGHEFRLLGNAVMPQVAEWIGRRILESI